MHHPRFITALLVLSCAVMARPLFAEEGNRLKLQSSRYLRLHAENPVDWYPWGPEAFAKAKQEDKPIFLSVGYMSCHWCHVMEEESFSNEEIADYLNEHFVCIKVDREERPDVDNIYMTASSIISQNTGWPLNVFLTPEGKPFFGISYRPPFDGQRGFEIGFQSILRRIDEIWNTRQEELQSSADLATRSVRRALGSPILPPKLDDPQVILQNLDQQIATEFDPQHGGFEFSTNNPQLPKFPQPAYLNYLLRRHGSGNAVSGNMLRLTLEKMAAGGIHDQLGGGFHRYSVDRFWRIPHFEKMLYDNAQLLSIYAQASRQLNEPKFAEVARYTADFVLSEMTGPQGQFFSALDADSDGQEGAYYLFSSEDISEVLGGDEQRLARQALGLGDEPNFEDEFFVPQDLGTGEPEKLAAVKQKLLDYREKRTRPERDNKVVASWNGLMIAGLADAGQILKEPKYIAAAEKAADFLLTKMTSESGRLRRTLDAAEDEAVVVLDDYAFTIAGLLSLHEATGKQRWLDEAVRLQNKQQELFGDDKQGGYFYSPEDDATLIVRGKLTADSALPSANAVSAGNLRRLAQLVPAESDSYEARAEKTIQASAELLNRFPTAAASMAAELIE